jgi:hypothetical protein
MNFDKLPADIKNIIFNFNREEAIKKKQEAIKEKNKNIFSDCIFELQIRAYHEKNIPYINVKNGIDILEDIRHEKRNNRYIDTEYIKYKFVMVKNRVFDKQFYDDYNSNKFKPTLEDQFI